MPELRAVADAERVRFPGGLGFELAGLIDRPADGEPRATALLSHCFTCSKDYKVLRRLARRLAQHGYLVLRFDFTGLGHSTGRFDATTFRTNLDDTRAAIGYLSERYAPPRLLAGHSLGGSGVLALAGEVESCRCAATLASASSLEHLHSVLRRLNPAIERDGAGEVTIGGHTLRIERALLDDLRSFDLDAIVARLDKPVLVLHGDADETTPIEQGYALFNKLRGPRAFVTLDGADHLLIRRERDADDAADILAAWAGRYVTS